MKLRSVTIFTGAKFKVPERIQRIDTRATHGWQLRYGRPDSATEMFSVFTNDGTGAEASLEKAVSALHKRIKKLPAPTGLRRKPLSSKTNDLPAGISGPTLRGASSPGRTPYYCYQVSVPRANGSSTTKAFYIGTERTANQERADAALAKAVEYREQAVKKYESARTRTKRAIASEMLANTQSQSAA